jgi:hypothetical protein
MAIKDALRNPTKQMRLTFRALPVSHKWLLVALLEVSAESMSELLNYFRGNREALSDLYEEYCPEKDREPFARVLEQLTEAFVKARARHNGQVMVDWIHPSYRDLVIDELVLDPGLRTSFLSRASLEGIKLAVSDSGGRFGERSQPLVRSAESWSVLRDRCLALAGPGTCDRELLEVLADSASKQSPGSNRERLGRILFQICGVIRERWGATRHLLSPKELKAFAAARNYSMPLAPLPDLHETWEALVERFRKGLRRADPDDFMDFDYGPFNALTAFGEAIFECSAKFLTSVDFPGAFEKELDAVFSNARAEASDRPNSSDPEELRGMAERADDVVTALNRLTNIQGRTDGAVSSLATRLVFQSESLREKAAENEPPEPDWDDGDRAPSTPTFDVDLLFSEL